MLLARSATMGEADEIGAKVDIAARTSAVGYEQTLARLKTTSALHPGADLPGGVSKGLLLIHKRH